MWSRLSVLGLLLATATISASVVGIRNSPRSGPSASPGEALAIRSDPAASPVEALNRRIQERFYTFGKFGMSRLIGLDHDRRFDPDTPEEKAAVVELRRQGWSVILYLGGRGLLEPPMSKIEWDEAGPHRSHRTISDPMLISGEKMPVGLPEPRELWEIGQKALAESTTGDKYTTSFGRWSIDARPVRATQAACLKCHQSSETDQEADLKVGDALGVAIYVFARTPK